MTTPLLAAPAVVAGIGTGIYQSNTVNPFVVQKPAGVQDGDIIVIVFTSQCNTGTLDIATPVGWTRVGPPFVAASTPFRYMDVFVKGIPSAAAETATSYTFDISNVVTGQRCQAMPFIVRGGMASDPISGGITSTQALANNTTTYPTGTPANGKSRFDLAFVRADFSAGSDGSTTSFGTAGWNLEGYWATQATAPTGFLPPSDTTNGRSVFGIYSKHFPAAASGENVAWVTVTPTGSKSSFNVSFNDYNYGLPVGGSGVGSEADAQHQKLGGQSDLTLTNMDLLNTYLAGDIQRYGYGYAIIKNWGVLGVDSVTSARRKHAAATQFETIQDAELRWWRS